MMYFFLLLYQVLDNLRFFNLQFNYTSQLYIATFLSFSEKKGDTKHFCKKAKVSSI